VARSTIARAHVRVRTAAHRRAGTAPRDDDAVGAQARERFAHGRARRREAFGERMLGQEPVAFLELAFHDAVQDVAVDPVGQTRRFPLVHVRANGLSE